MPKLAGVNHLDAVRAFQKAGFWILRQGKHLLMTDGMRLLTIPRHNPVNAITKGISCGTRDSRTMSFGSLFDEHRRSGTDHTP